MKRLLVQIVGLLAACTLIAAPIQSHTPPPYQLPERSQEQRSQEQALQKTQPEVGVVEPNASRPVPTDSNPDPRARQNISGTTLPKQENRNSATLKEAESQLEGERRGLPWWQYALLLLALALAGYVAKSELDRRIPYRSEAAH